MGSYVLPGGISRTIHVAVGDGCTGITNGFGSTFPSKGGGGGDCAVTERTDPAGTVYNISASGPPSTWSGDADGGPVMCQAAPGDGSHGPRAGTTGDTVYGGGMGYEPPNTPGNTPGGGGGTGARYNAEGIDASDQTGAADAYGSAGAGGAGADPGNGSPGEDAPQGPGNGGGGHGGSGASYTPPPPNEGNFSSGGYAIWNGDDWDDDAGTPVPGAVPLYFEGSYQPAPELRAGVRAGIVG